MILLPASAYPSLIDTIDGLDINTLFARSVLTGDVGGQVYGDREDNPSSWYIVHPYGMTLLFGACPSPSFWADLSRYFTAISKDQWLQACPSAWHAPLRELVAAGRACEYSRLNFRFSPQRFHAQNSDISMDRYQVVRTPVELIGSLEGTVVPKDFWKPERYGSCVGFTVFVDGEPASTAYSSYIHGNTLEFGIETMERHRGKGLARVACVALIRYCLEHSLTPDWSCRYENTGSSKLAERLGFVQTKRFPYFHIPAGQ